MALIVKSKTIKLSLEWNDNDDNPDLDEGSSHAPSEAAKEDVVKEEEQEQMEDDSDYRSLASIASQSSSEAANETIEEFEEEEDEAPEDCFVRISVEEKMKAIAAMNKEFCIVRISAEEKMKSDSVFNKAANETIEEFEEEDDFVKRSPVSLPDSSMVKSTVMECLKGKKIILV